MLVLAAAVAVSKRVGGWVSYVLGPGPGSWLEGRRMSGDGRRRWSMTPTNYGAMRVRAGEAERVELRCAGREKEVEEKEEGEGEEGGARELKECTRTESGRQLGGGATDSAQRSFVSFSFTERRTERG